MLTPMLGEAVFIDFERTKPNDTWSNPAIITINEPWQVMEALNRSRNLS